MTALPRHRFTESEYLEFERRSSMRHEFHRGEIFDMSGASEKHNRIVTNLSTALDIQLRDRHCDVYSTDMRVKVEASRLYTYPDVLVVCEEKLLEETARDVLLNPTIIIEVLSPSTEDYDRGVKFDHYRQIESLTDYVLVRQDAHHVEHRQRQDGGQWKNHEFRVLEDVVKLTSIGCDLPLTEIYRRVTVDQ